MSMLVMCGCAVVGHGAERDFQSGPARTSLIELYTSEGCSSCPPAERWLSQLRSDPGLWKTFVPVAFHVTYWDNLGWPDRFAQKQFTEREYAYSHLWRSDSVYTPCFVRDGAEWKPQGSLDPATDKAGTLTARVRDDGLVVATFEPPTRQNGEYQIWAALLLGEVDSDVKRGENAGRKLRHDFTAIQMVNTSLSTAETAGTFRAALQLPIDQNAAGRAAVAVWVTRSHGPGEVLQATGGWLSR